MLAADLQIYKSYKTKNTNINLH